MKKKLTLKTIDALSAKDKDFFVWDEELKGFGLKVTPAGKKIFIVQYRIGGRGRPTLGALGAGLNPDSARKKAKSLLGQVTDGIDPARAKQEHKKQITVAELAERYLSDHAKQHKKERSYTSDESNINHHVKPLLGNLMATEVKRSDIERFQRAIKEGKTAKDIKSGKPRSLMRVRGGSVTSNRCLALLSKMFSLSEKWGIRQDGSNPCRHVQRYEERKLERYLTSEEFVRLGDVLHAWSNSAPYIVAVIRLLIFTGCRLGEILTLKWEYVDLKQNIISLPDSKTGAKKIFLSPPAIAILEKLPREEGNPYVCVGTKSGKHVVNIAKPWAKIRVQAQISDVRLHDLRHSFASIAVSQGQTLEFIGKLLGHKNLATTQRYAHLFDNPIRAANDRIATGITAAMGIE